MESQTTATSDSRDNCSPKIMDTIARSAVRDVLLKYKNHFHGWRIPLLVQELACFMPVVVRDIRISDVPNGRVEFSSNGAVILVPRSFTRVRRRIEAAHELAHVLIEQELSKSSSPYLNSLQPDPSNIIENLCDKTGRLLLVPDDLFPSIDSLEHEPVLSQVIVQLAKQFEVPVPSTAMRLIDWYNAIEKLLIKQIIVWQIKKDMENPQAIEVIAIWHACSEFIPHGSKARKGSITHKAAVTGLTNINSLYGKEQVSIGPLDGSFYVDACPYAYSPHLKRYSRVVTVFREDKVSDKIGTQSLFSYR